RSSAAPRSALAAVGRDRLSSERGIVQSVSTGVLVLKALDGSTVSIAVDARTRVVVDGKRGAILDVRPGFVAVVTARGASGQAALEVDAFSSSPTSVEAAAGVVRSVSPGEVVLDALDGARVRVAVDAATQVL